MQRKPSKWSLFKANLTLREKTLRGFANELGCTVEGLRKAVKRSKRGRVHKQLRELGIMNP